MLDGTRLYAIDDYRNGLWLCVGFAIVALVASLRIRETFCRNLN
jgi:hypothetical protein